MRSTSVSLWVRESEYALVHIICSLFCKSCRRELTLQCLLYCSLAYVIKFCSYLPLMVNNIKYYKPTTHWSRKKVVKQTRINRNNFFTKVLSPGGIFEWWKMDHFCCISDITSVSLPCAGLIHKSSMREYKKYSC